MPGAAVVPSGLASCCAVLSFFGVIILTALGWGFQAEVEVLTGSTSDPEDSQAVAKLCYSTAIVYAIFFGVCSCQALTHARYARQGQVRL
ncbi:hypothetical protein P389DRAFT_52415 [Cystobasidium minutum MCA 4210]|uniref:uncharacterized protein n=1 Tax=Cystobasidium minutum MCA 4210 TaxID=1397322 RepID=UPI0034D00068|eukprot:jgi/Rhomi1/52415/CE52414_2268